MRQIKTFSDSRLDNMCSYCGDYPGTGDHVPSKTLLESPFPENLPKVPCCDNCNQGFSKDEEYFACTIECILHGTAEVEKLKREKIKAILSKKESLRMRLQNSFSIVDDKVFFKFEQSRFEHVITKLAKGHAKFENNEVKIDAPDSIVFTAVPLMTQQEVDSFINNDELHIAPEVGSRALSNLYLFDSDARCHWEYVQDGIYQYCVLPTLGGVTVKIIIWNYLVVEVIWGH